LAQKKAWNSPAHLLQWNGCQPTDTRRRASLAGTRSGRQFRRISTGWQCGRRDGTNRTPYGQKERSDGHEQQVARVM